MTEIHKEALEQFEASSSGTAELRAQSEDDVRFAKLGEQWPDQVRKQREEEGRPILTINRLPSFINQVVNDSRQNKPGVVVTPNDGEGDEDAARVIGGLIRNIERRSQAEIAYDTAIDHAVTGGFGFFQVGIDYVHEDSFSLEARIERIANPFSVHWDVDSTQFDASDWNYAFVSDMLSEDEFKARYPKADASDFEGAGALGDTSWLEHGKVRLATYWRRDESDRKLLLLRGAGGEKAIREEAIPDMARQALLAGGLDAQGVSDDDLIRAYLDINGLEVARERMSRFNKVKKFTLNGNEVLDEEDWPGSMIPICPVWGSEVIIDGKRSFRSMIHDAKDPQTMFNFWRTASTELVALAPRAPFIGPAGFVPRGHESKWASANTRSHAYLEYEPSAGMPQRQAFAGVPAGALQEALNASDDMKSVIGIYDAALGARSNETSGKAILARQAESDVANFHFLDNLAHAIAYAGRVLVEIIPAVYTPQETVRILGEDDKDEVVRLTSEHGEVVDGEQRLYNLSVGTYDVATSSGTSYKTQREEARTFLVEIMQQVPGAAQLIGDIALENMDFDGADRAAARLKSMLPPQIQQSEGIGGPPVDMGGQPAPTGAPPFAS